MLKDWMQKGACYLDTLHTRVGKESLPLRTKKKGRRTSPATASTFLGRKREFKFGCLLADLCFGALQKRGNMSDSTPVFDPIAKGEQILLGPFLTGVEARLFGHAIHPNSRALSLTSLQAAVRKSANLIEVRLYSFLGKLLARS